MDASNTPLSPSNHSIWSKEESERNDAIVASLIIITSLFGLITYIPCIAAICKAKQLKSPCYTFIISLGFSDCTSLFAWLIIGIHTASHGMLIPKSIVTAIFAMLDIGWGSLAIHEAMIAVNRYIAVCHPDKHELYFNRKRMIILLIMSYLYAVGIHASATFVPPHMVYFMKSYTARWLNQNVIAYYTYSEPLCAAIIFIICIFSYVSVIVKYTHVRKLVSPDTTIANKSKEAKDKKEAMFQFRLTLQTAIRSLTFFCYDLLFFFITFSTSNLWAVFICATYLWCLNNAICPWIYLCFNGRLRKVLKGYILRENQMGSNAHLVALP